MTTVHSKALEKTLTVKRLIGQVKGKNAGPTLVFTAGIHGNEPSGVFALQQVIDYINSRKIPLKGSLYAIAGNLRALQQGRRYLQEDLNRIWVEERINGLGTGDNLNTSAETVQQAEIYHTISEIVTCESGPFYFIDLHTTSSDTPPFITVNDNLLNRKFTLQYPVPLLLGIEEYLDGTLLNYINRLGYVAFGFESGQHDALSSIENHYAFVCLTLVLAGALSKNEIDFEKNYEVLYRTTSKLSHVYEIVYHHKLKKEETFSMHPGFQNFEAVRKGQCIADSNRKPVKVPTNGQIFMPLYQKQGEDGFFIIQTVPKIFLKLSAILRQIRFDHLLPLLPGVSWISKKRDALRVNLKVAKFFAKKFFHLLGYRSRQIDADHLVIRNREAGSKKKSYNNEVWY